MLDNTRLPESDPNPNLPQRQFRQPFPPGEKYLSLEEVITWLATGEMHPRGWLKAQYQQNGIVRALPEWLREHCDKAGTEILRALKNEDLRAWGYRKDDGDERAQPEAECITVAYLRQHLYCSAEDNEIGKNYIPNDSGEWDIVTRIYCNVYLMASEVMKAFGAGSTFDAREPILPAPEPETQAQPAPSQTPAQQKAAMICQLGDWLGNYVAMAGKAWPLPVEQVWKEAKAAVHQDISREMVREAMEPHGKLGRGKKPRRMAAG